MAALIVTLSYWFNVPFDGYTIFVPLISLFNTGLTTLVAAVLATISGMIANAIWPTGSIWVATGIFVLVVFVIILSANPATDEVDRALGSLGFIVPTVLAATWFLFVTRPVLAGKA